MEQGNQPSWWPWTYEAHDYQLSRNVPFQHRFKTVFLLTCKIMWEYFLGGYTPNETSKLIWTYHHTLLTGSSPSTGLQLFPIMNALVFYRMHQKKSDSNLRKNWEPQQNPASLSGTPPTGCTGVLHDFLGGGWVTSWGIYICYSQKGKEFKWEFVLDLRLVVIFSNATPSMMPVASEGLSGARWRVGSHIPKDHGSLSLDSVPLYSESVQLI